MQEIREKQSFSPGTSLNLDVTRLQAQTTWSREHLTGKALVTAEQELREHVTRSHQDRLAHFEMAEDRRGLLPSPENRLPLGLDPQRYSGLGGCDQCEKDEKTAKSHDRHAKKYKKKVDNNWNKHLDAQHVGDFEEAATYFRKYGKYEELATREQNEAAALRNQIAARHA